MQPERLTETVQLAQPTPSAVYTTFVLLSVVYMLTMNYSCLYLAELRSIQNRCNFATICARKG